MSKKTKTKRRTFTEEFKRSAVNLVVAEGYSIRTAAQAVNVSESNLRAWFQKFAPASEQGGPDASLEQVLAENKRLRKELRLAELVACSPKPGPCVMRV